LFPTVSVSASAIALSSRRQIVIGAVGRQRLMEAIAQWREILLAKGKTKMQGVGAVMHKLLSICFGVLKSFLPP